MPGHRLILRPMSNRERHSPLAMHPAVFERVLVLLVAGLALCYGEGNNMAFTTPVSAIWAVSAKKAVVAAAVVAGTGAKSIKPHTQTGRGTCPGVGL